jgi:hypothetical protein
MTLSRLITWMAGVSAISIQALPPFERLRLAPPHPLANSQTRATGRTKASGRSPTG